MNIKKIGLVSLVMGVFLMGYWLNPYLRIKNMEQHRKDFVEHKEMMVGAMIADGKYRCCLEKPCTYCIEKTPKHGEGASCSCLDDVVNGQHPCGECMGEILEGHGNKYLKKYFAIAIAEEVGEEYINTLRQIISDKYQVLVENQL